MLLEDMSLNTPCKYYCMHASNCRQHIGPRRPHPSSIAGRLARGLTPRLSWGFFFFLHEICVFKHDLMIFIWYQRQSESRLRRVGTASPGAARFPSHCGRLGRTLRGGTCACQMLFSLSFPNLLISFCSERTKKARQSQQKPRRATFLSPCVRVMSTLHFMCQ